MGGNELLKLGGGRDGDGTRFVVILFGAWLLYCGMIVIIIRLARLEGGGGWW